MDDGSKSNVKYLKPYTLTCSRAARRIASLLPPLQENTRYAPGLTHMIFELALGSMSHALYPPTAFTSGSLDVWQRQSFYIRFTELQNSEQYIHGGAKPGTKHAAVYMREGGAPNVTPGAMPTT